MLDEHHLFRSFEIGTGEDGVEWAAESLHMPYAFWIDVKPTFTAQAIKLSNIVNTSTAILQRKATITYQIQSLLSYKRAFEKESGVRFVNIYITDIVQEVMFSSFLAAISTAIHVHFISFGKMINKHQKLSYLPLKLCKDARATSSLSITDHDDPILYISS